MPLDYVLGSPVRCRNGDSIVRLADDARKCVVFIGSAKVGAGAELDPWGTGFLVSNGEPGGIYVVTARHVAQPFLGCPVSIRFNKADDGADLLHIDEPHWLFHPSDETVDVAILGIDPPDWAEIVVFPQHPGILLDDRFESKNIGPGDLVYIVGIWKFLYGTKRNQPFVHTGHIGLIPEDERVPVENWYDEKGDPLLIEAYLVEGEPLDGASGSPVFVRRSLEAFREKSGGKPPLEAWLHGSVWLLGLLQGAWFGKPGKDYQIPPSKTVPRGVNVVVPSMKIAEVLNQPAVKDRSRQIRAERDSARAATPLSSTRAMADNPSHKEDFTRLLGAAAKTRKQDGQT